MTLRPLDPLRSIKVKLGVLVAASVAVASLLVWLGLTELGWWPRYTLPVAVLAALGVTQLLARGMTSPLRSMTAAARAMARGDYSRRVHTASRDEVGELAAAFNRMAADLEAADTSRRELIANVSHELRTPITALQAVLENVVDGVAHPDPATLRLALAQTERLGRLVSELLDLSRIDAGSQPLNRADVPVAEVVRAATAEASLAACNVRYAADVQPRDLRAYADEARLRQVLANLLDNAARHSPAGGTVLVRARAAGHGVRVEVLDEGSGVPAA
jgi:signal transduction histidine kinase